jgi:VanZ family protein
VPRVEHADKVTHVALYAVLAFLAARAEPAASRTLRGGALVLAGGSAFGAFDEWHQQLVPGRSSSTGDWLADSLGAALGALAARRRRPEPSA